MRQFMGNGEVFAAHISGTEKEPFFDENGPVIQFIKDLCLRMVRNFSGCFALVAVLNMFPYSYWASTCLAALPTYSAFMISVRQAGDLPPASFRFPVARGTLALGYILPAVGRIVDWGLSPFETYARWAHRKKATGEAPIAQL